MANFPIKTNSLDATSAPTSSVASNASARDLQVIRETVESLAVAFILALLFKAFIAEAFVIPTGSMAPTLMGAHKDVQCKECGFQYQCGASQEYDSETQQRRAGYVFGTVCPLCRKPQTLDLDTNRNHATFPGDRILVSKLAYAWKQPRRWDVIVFKYLEDARLNYIKRCVGRPREYVRIQDGDIYVKPLDEEAKKASSRVKNRVTAGYTIARKPPHVVNAMLQPLFDSNHLSRSMVDANVPDPWQPFPVSKDAPDGNWSVTRSSGTWSAKLTGRSPSTKWIRYYHRVLDPLQWNGLEKNGTLPKPIPADSYRIVTDFTAYNQYFMADGEVPPNYAELAPKWLEERQAYMQLENDGVHWTGDLAGEWEFKTASDAKAIRLLLVESGVEHECVIDLATGGATATIRYQDKVRDAFESPTGDALLGSINANTPIRAGGRHRVRFANVDDCLFLWVDNRSIPFNNGGLVNTESFLDPNDHAPVTSPTNPLDAAPVAFGVDAGGCELFRARVFRDIYYIAHSFRENLSDYSNQSAALHESASNVKQSYLEKFHGKSARDYMNRSTQDGLERNAIVSDANAWANSPMASSRRIAEFPLDSDWYFPMGDNSSASSDARSWYDHHTPARLMIGRAVLVFWPHYWNSPVPFIPNFQRMGLIR